MQRRILISTLAATIVGAAGAVAFFGIRQTARAEEIVIYKDPSCGCCTAWVEHLRASGFTASVRERVDLRRTKAELGVPEHLQSCHTATIEDYVIEGHVPAADIRRLLAERPKARGVAVPGMPVGSPGMEQGAEREPYNVILFQGDGADTIFVRH